MTYAFIVDSVPFSKATRDGLTSLGGSESACLGLARALRRRGHDVHLFTTQIDPDAIGLDPWGCAWHPIADFATMNQFIEWDVVVALRWFSFFGRSPVQARLRLLWNQDLLVPGAMVAGVMSVAWALDALVYVSDYQRAQWEDLEPCLTGHGYVTRNGFDPADLPKGAATKDPNRIIHISRPERGLKPLLQLWPTLRALKPNATLRICRYSSMYDQGPGSWSDTCDQYDRGVHTVNAAVGGIEYLGELTKPQLYQAVSEAAVMWYPGVATFAETSCIAATEANACGTPFVGSLKGALAETARPSYDAGLLMPGVAGDERYGEAAIAKVLDVMDGCAKQSFQYRALQRAGKKHAEAYTHDVLAAEWDAWIEQTFKERYASKKVGILRQLLHEDDHVAARMVATDILGPARSDDREHPCSPACPRCEAVQAERFCDYVIAGKDHSAEHYGAAALADPLQEAETSDRFRAVNPHFEKCTKVLDVACGNGSFAIGLALANPNVSVYGLDFAEANITRATEGAQRAGVAERCHFDQCTVYDFDAQAMHREWTLPANQGWLKGAQFDGMFVGEFVEHVGNCSLLIDALETVLIDGAKVVYTCPSGACAEIFPRWQTLHRGHVHRFHHDDLKAVWGPKKDFGADYLSTGTTERGNPLGNWLIAYTVAPNRPAGQRPLATRIQRTRPMPKLSVGIIAKDAEQDLARCLTTVWPIADELILGDTGSTDQTKAIAAQYKARVIDVTSVHAQPEGFAGARNAVLAACTGDWFLWIDTDEQLVDGFWLRRYLDGAIFNGFVLQQTHLYLDGPPTHDIPVRVFRRDKAIRFFGCIHEQPQMGEVNTDIHPTLEPYDVKIAHTGYLTERIRSDKRVSRNLPLLIKDAQVFPERTLGHVLRIREAVIQADEICAHAGGMTEKAQQGYRIAVQGFVQHFDDPTHKYHKLARPWYEAALQHLGMGYEFELGMAGKQGPMGQSRARPERLWVRDAGELQRLLDWKSAELRKSMAPVTFKTDPFVLPDVPVRERQQVSA
jgi:glycosyltransferase involved in cell wall biosynthesis/2-polyprenyl-3-methyl-5-hydroxy-6-metoxy-1,4-benzoquinol methylase